MLSISSGNKPYRLAAAYKKLSNNNPEDINHKKADPLKLNIVNKDLQFNKVSLIEPTSRYYLHVAAEVDKSFFPFYLITGNRKKSLIKQCKQYCNHIQAENNIVCAVVFEAMIIPPGQGELIKRHRDKVHIDRFDVVVLIEQFYFL